MGVVRGLIGAGVLVLGVVSSALAHNSWVTVTPARVDVGGDVRMAFGTGWETFPESGYPTRPQRVATWVVREGDATIPVGEPEGKDNELVASASCPKAGSCVVGVALAPADIQMEGAEFQEYLQEEHATEALALRERTHASTRPAHETYTKFAKSFFVVGAPVPANYEPVVFGHRLEIVPLVDPCGLRAGDDLPVRVLLDGKPASGLVLASVHGPGTAHDYAESVTTDGKGEATMWLDRPGLWMVRTHLIRPIARPKRGQAEWESFWATMTLTTGERPPASE